MLQYPLLTYQESFLLFKLKFKRANHLDHIVYESLPVSVFNYEYISDVLSDALYQYNAHYDKDIDLMIVFNDLQDKFIVVLLNADAKYFSKLQECLDIVEKDK